MSDDTKLNFAGTPVKPQKSSISRFTSFEGDAVCERVAEFSRKKDTDLHP
jgi:hypothetical protein